MTDGRPRDDESGGFDWLYGTPSKGMGSDEETQVIRPQDRQDRTGPPAARPAPGGRDEPGSEHTRVLGTVRPAGPRAGSKDDVPGSSRAGDAHPRGSGGAPPFGAAPTPDAPPPGKPRRGRRRFRLRPVKLLLLLVVLWLAFMVAVPLLAWNTVSKVDAEPDGERPGDQPGTTYLLVGSDSREGLTARQRKRLHTGGAAGRRTDTIMLLHTGDGPNLLLSIPRDSIVSIPGRGDGQKINAAYAYGGPKLLVQTIENSTGIRIDNYVEIGFGGFVKMVNAVGGITICPEQAMNDPAANLKVKAGCQPAKGRKALAYARSRKTSQLGDIDRASHQREVVAAIGSEAFSPWTFLNPWRYYRLNFSAADSIHIGENVGVLDVANFAMAMRSVSGDKGLTCGVPIADLTVNWDRERAERMFRLIREDRTAEIGQGLCRPSGLAR